jgi:hypothetical protein
VIIGIGCCKNKVQALRRRLRRRAGGIHSLVLIITRQQQQHHRRRIDNHDALMNTSYTAGRSEDLWVKS